MKHYVILLFVLAACHRPTDTADQWLHDAGTLVWDAPDSILAILQAADTTDLNSLQHAEYVLLKVQAKDEAGHSITGDTAIFHAKRLLAAAGDAEKAARACFYAGRVYQGRGNKDAAALHYLKAADIAESTDDEHLKGDIRYYAGKVYYSSRIYPEALSKFAEAATYYQRSEDLAAVAKTVINQGNCYLVTGQADSALACFKRALEIATRSRDTTTQAGILQNMGVVYIQTGDVTKAGDMYQQAIDLTTDRNNQAQLTINLAEIYFEYGQTDQALASVQQVFEHLDTANHQPQLANVYRLMLLAEARKNNDNKIIDYFKKHTSYLGKALETKNKQATLEIQKKYELEKVQNDNNRLMIQRRNLVIVVLCVVVFSLFLAVLTFIVIRKKKHRENTIADLHARIDTLQGMRDEARKTTAIRENDLAEKMDTIENLKTDLAIASANVKKLQEEAGKNAETPKILAEEMKKAGEIAGKLKIAREQKNILFRGLLIRYFNVLQKIEKLDKAATKENEKELMKKINRILYGESETKYWDAIHGILPHGMQEKLKNICPALDNTEIRICCLAYFNINNSEMAMILNLAITSLNTSKTGIRRKLGISKAGNIGDFLDGIL